VQFTKYLHKRIKTPSASMEKIIAKKKADFYGCISPTLTVQFYCNTVPPSYMIDERKLLFYRKILLSKNVVLRTLMCLPAVSSDFMFCAVSMVSGLLQLETVQDAQLSQRDRAAGCVIVFAKSRTLELGDNDLRTL